MFGLNHASKAGLVLLSIFSLNLLATSAFAQSLDPVQSSATAESGLTDDLAGSSTADETAMLELLEALNTDGISIEAIAPIETDTIKTETAEVSATETNVIEEPPVADPTVQPTASALSGLESASINDTALAEPATRDLSAVNIHTNVDPDAVPALRASLNSDSALTRLYAADALWTLTGDRDLILPTLMTAAVDGDTQAQELAIAAIAQLGKEALPAVPILNDLSSDRNSRTRQIAQDALAIVRSERRSSTVLGIIARESRQRLVPAAFRAITNLFR